MYPLEWPGAVRWRHAASTNLKAAGDNTVVSVWAVKRSEIEELLKDDLAFRDELTADRDSAKERAKAEYLRALAEIDELTERAEREYRYAVAEADERIVRADRAVERWRAKLAERDGSGDGRAST